MSEFIFNISQFRRRAFCWQKSGIACLTFFLCFMAADAQHPNPGDDGSSGKHGLTLQVPGLPSDPKDIAWEFLPLLGGERTTIFKGEENLTAFNHHPMITYFQDRFLAAWSNGDKDEDASGQRVLYATSQDGIKWTGASKLTPGIVGMAYTPSGFWIRDGKLYMLAALRRARDAGGHNEPELQVYQWNAETSSFEYLTVISKNFLANDSPRLTSDGQWLMFGRPHVKTSSSENVLRMAKGGKESLDDWSFRQMPVVRVPHDTFWYTLPDGSIVAIESEGGVPDRRIIIMRSTDNGDSWTDPQTSNFPEADSRLYGLRLSNGRYVLICNPNLARYRVPLSVAVSSDGLIYDRIANVRIEQTNKRYSGHAKAPGYQYVRAMEHDKRLWVIYSVNKEDVEVASIPLTEIDRLYSTNYRYAGNDSPADRIIIDNTDKGFTTDAPWPKDTTVGIYDGMTMGFQGTNYAYHGPGEGKSKAWAKWTPRIVKPGTYAVYMRWAATEFGSRSPMSDVAPIEISHDGGVRQSSVDQTRYGGKWIWLGNYDFKAGRNGYVRIFTSAGGITVADAVKFEKVD